MRILLADSDPMAAQALAKCLEPEGFQVALTHAGAEVLSLLRHYEFDLALIDLSMPDIEGTALISRMRSARREIPVLALARGSSSELRLRALTAGADDAVHRQTDVLELIARMNAIIRRSRGYSQSLLTVGPVSLNIATAHVSANNVAVDLTQREFSILKALMLRKNMILTKSALMNALYDGMDEPEAKIIDVFVCKIRKKLAKAGCHDVIGTVWGRGYTVQDNAGQHDKAPKPLVPQPVAYAL